jgi:hypothetical protein
MRHLIRALIVVLAVVALTLLYRRLEESYPLLRFERRVEAQRLINLRGYASREQLGSFLPPNDAQLAIRESLLQDILSRSLPIREKFENGKYEARLDKAILDLGDGLATITMFGHGRVLDPKAPPIEADLKLETHIDVVEFRPDAGTLRAGLAITDAHVIRTKSRMGGAFANPAARYFGSLKVEDWNRQRPTLDIPIRVEQEITLPRIEGDFSVDSCRIPLAVGISALTVLQDRLVISLALGQDKGAPLWTVVEPQERKRSENELIRLYRRGLSHFGHQALLDRVRAFAARDKLWRGLVHSDRDVVAVVPLPVLQSLCDRVARSYIQGARLDFDPNVRAHIDQELRFRVLGGMAGAGHIRGSVRVTHLHGRLSVDGDPKLKLLPPDGLQLTTPIRVLHGSGQVNLDMEWDPNFLVAVVCRGFKFQETLTGEVRPFTHSLQTRIRFTSDGSSVIGSPQVRRDRVTVPCEFTPESLAKVRAALLEQDKFLKCGMAMNADSVLARLRTLVRRDVQFRMPERLFKPFSLPVSLRQQYEGEDFRITARMEDSEVSVRPEYLRFGFRGALQVKPK